jgi:multidrug efflux pump subunit AcrB
MPKDFDERKALLEEMKEKLKNPLFRAANEQLVKKLEREVKEQEAEEKIRKYLRDENPGASFAQVIMDTRVDMKILEQLIADGRVNIRVNNADWEQLEEEQRKMLEALVKTGKLLSDKSRVEKSAKEENTTRASGMYSKKESLESLKKNK